MLRSHIKEQVEVATSRMQIIEDAYIANQEEGGCNKESRRFCFLHIAFINEPIIMWDNNSIATLNISNKPASI